jgi:hypothetical protein
MEKTYHFESSMVSDVLFMAEAAGLGHEAGAPTRMPSWSDDIEFVEVRLIGNHEAFDCFDEAYEEYSDQSFQPGFIKA